MSLLEFDLPTVAPLNFMYQEVSTSSSRRNPKIVHIFTLVHVLHVFQPPCCLLEEVHTSWYTNLSGATVLCLTFFFVNIVSL